MERWPYLIVGAGPCGAAAAAELARLAGPGSVALVGDERHPPYERPPLSKQALHGEAAGATHLHGGDEGLQAAGVRLILGEAVLRLDPVGKSVETASGRRLGYGRLLLATGASPRRLDGPGFHLPGVHYLRSFDDALALRGGLAEAERVLVIGGGFIGLEVAASARRMGRPVTVLEAGDRLMGRAVPRVVAEAFMAKFRAEGVEVRLNAIASRLEGERRVVAAILADGAVIPADLVVVGVGSAPNTRLAEQAGLRVEGGVSTDEQGRTADPDVFAAGDVASREHEIAGHPRFSARLEAWEPALEQGAAVARIMAGEAPVPPRPPWVWSDQFDWNLQIVGHGALADAEVVRGDPESGVFAVLQLSRSRLVGAIAVNAGRLMTPLRRAIEQGVVLDRRLLADEGVPLRDALKPAAPAQPS